MAKNVDKDDGEPDGAKPSGVPPRGAAPEPTPEPLPDGFLPEDSFLLDLDDESARAPAPMIEQAGTSEPNEEWLLVDDDEAAAPAMPAEVQKAEPAPTPDEAVAASSAGAAPATKVPAWYNEDEAELPKFVAEESEEPAAAAAGAAAGAATASTSVVEPVLAAQAPVIPLTRARRKRQLAAAAGLLLTLGGASYWYFALRGGDDDGATEVAVNLPPKKAPKPAPPEPAPEPAPEPSPAIVTPVPEPEPEPVVTPEPEPVAVVPEPAVEVKTPTTTSPTIVESGRRRPLPPLTREGSKSGTVRKDDVIVELKNGNTFRGQITRTKGSRVTLKVGAGECVFDLSEVTLLDSSAPEYRRIDQMPEASVHLTTGAHLRGRLMKQNDEHVVLVINNGQVVFDRSNVQKVSFTGRIHF